MATDEQIRTFFQAAAPRAAELRAQYRVLMDGGVTAAYWYGELSPRTPSA